MKLIAHRGCIDGPNELENSPSFILAALKEGFDVEIDVWYVGCKFFLGHDEPKYEVDANFLLNDRLWCHAKNKQALVELMYWGVTHAFWHDVDDLALTTSSLYWVFPGKMTGVLKRRGIYVMPELVYDISEIAINVKDCFGVCSDYVRRIKEDLDHGL